MKRYDKEPELDTFSVWNPDFHWTPDMPMEMDDRDRQNANSGSRRNTGEKNEE